MDTLSEHQREAIEQYFALVSRCPDLFTGRERRPVVLDREVLEAHVAGTDVVLGVVARTPYLWMLNDLVESSSGTGTLRHPYLRVIRPPGFEAVRGVAVLATVELPDGSGPGVVLVEQDRHATGGTELEIPRGFGVPGVDSARQALDELVTESGYVGEDITRLGTLMVDSGSSDSLVDFFHVAVQRRTEAAPEPEEAIAGVVVLPLDTVWENVFQGVVRDGFTVQALALYQQSLLRKGL